MAGKFIVLSDIHLNLWGYGDPEERLDDQIYAIEVVMGRAVEEDVDAVLWTGDIFHTQGQVHTQVLRALYGVLSPFRSDLKDKTVFLPGNHDMVYRDHSSVHALDFLSLFGQLPMMQSSIWGGPINIPNMPQIWAFPYTDLHDQLARWLDLFQNRDHDLLLLHQGVRNVEFKSRGFVLDEGLSASMIPPGVFHAFVGHCHSMRRVSSNMTVPGALQQHNFGDVGDPRGFLLVEYNESGLTFQHIPVGNTRFIDIPYTDDLPSLVDQINGERVDLPNEFIRISNVPVSKVDEVRAWTKDVGGNDLKITTRDDVHVPLRVQQHEIGDIESLLTRFAKENDLGQDLLKVGYEILKGAEGGVS